MPQTTSALLDGLNEEQQDAITTTEGPVLIIAGPGSGKTRVIIQKIAYLIAEIGADPQSILAVTFTNKAASEMVDRLQQVLMPEQARAVQMSTFHKFCGMMNRRYSTQIGLNNEYSIYDREDQTVVVKRAMTTAGLQSNSTTKPRDVLAKISFAKSLLLNPHDYARRVYEDDLDLDYAAEIAADVYPHYQTELRLSNALDFDDLINRTVHILRNDDRVRRRTHLRYRYILIDEYQDTNHAQNVLAQLVTGPHNNICVVGDPDQSIYGWRNADISNIIDFPSQYPSTKIVRLGRNYRSTDQILSAAQALITHNHQHIPNPLTAIRGDGPLINVNQVEDNPNEATWIIQQFSDLIERTPSTWSDCAVAYRMNAQSRVFEEECIRLSIPYILIGGVEFYQRREIKDLLSYLRFVINPADTTAVQRIINLPPRRIGVTTVNKLLEHSDRLQQTIMQSVRAVTSDLFTTDKPDLSKAATKALFQFTQMFDAIAADSADHTLTQLFDLIIHTTGYDQHIKADEDGDDRWQNILELRSMTEEPEYADRPAKQTLPAFLERVSLIADTDNYDPEQGQLTLITLHKAKGLEFEAVAIPGVVEGVLPSARADNIEEERRLCYVGITRAKQHLFMTCPSLNQRYGRLEPAEPSRFLAEIPDRYIISHTEYPQTYRGLYP